MSGMLGIEAERFTSPLKRPYTRPPAVPALCVRPAALSHHGAAMGLDPNESSYCG